MYLFILKKRQNLLKIFNSTHTFHLTAGRLAVSGTQTSESDRSAAAP